MDNVTTISGTGITARRGAAHGEMRQHNTRLVLDLLRHHHALATAEIARLSALSAQAVSVLIRALEQQGIVQRGKPVRGRIGQPSAPFSLDPDIAFYPGARIGRRGAELVVLDVVGPPRLRLETGYAWPDPSGVLDWLREAVAQAIVSTVALTDCRNIVIDGAFPPLTGEDI